MFSTVEMYKSINGGDTWAAANSGLPLSDAFTVDASVPDVLYTGFGTGLYTSTDGGKSWTAVPAFASTAVNSVYAVPSLPGTTYVGTEGGVFETADGGVSWTNVLATSVSGLVVAPSSAGTVYVNTSDGIVRTIDGGVTWTAAADSGLTASVRTLVVDPSSPQTLYAGTSQGIFKSVDGGDNWAVISTGLTTPIVNALHSIPPIRQPYMPPLFLSVCSRPRMEAPHGHQSQVCLPEPRC